MTSFRIKLHAGRTTIRHNLSDADKSAAIDMKNSMDGIIKNFKLLSEHVDNVTPEILMEAMEPAFALSQVYCPMDTGTMVASGYLQVIERYHKPTVEMGYGKGGNPSYTAQVHENLEWRHKKPTQAKWLSRALEESYGQINAQVMLSLKSIVG